MEPAPGCLRVRRRTQQTHTQQQTHTERAHVQQTHSRLRTRSLRRTHSRRLLSCIRLSCSQLRLRTQLQLHRLSDTQPRHTRHRRTRRRQGSRTSRRVRRAPAGASHRSWAGCLAACDAAAACSEAMQRLRWRGP